ncbi:L,D-transpeptidase [Eubacterium pyruvativorans]|uniref:L,D-transpeptidase n=1 Tax=Eubacterium pyruvativorans TaxID=155865 RepID=UPI001568CF2D|nr:L,D-transpeptidase family protein [Eubacterium pyruvativorans]MDY4049892.1 L,D-transpeptidase family protein [Eubacterium pyruvativorans]
MIKNRKSNGLLLLLLSAVLTLLLLGASAQQAHGAVYNGKYWLKVNKQASVITAYRRTNGRWKPVRAMLTSTGAPSMPTKSGTYYSSMKRRWLTMSMDGKFFDYGQYTCRVYGQVYIHSVWYYAKNHAAQATAEFNKLGSPASHGCIRVSTADAKWIYDNCPAGTKITVYSSSKPGPLGKPLGTKVSTARQQYWDPTDPAKGNPYYIMRKPVITVSPKKRTTVNYGSRYNLKTGVTAKDPNSFMDLTKYLKITGKYQWKNHSWKKVSGISTKNLGAYKVTYYVNDPWGRSASKSFRFDVKDLSKPVIRGAKSVTVTEGQKNAVAGVTASQKTGSRTAAIQVKIVQPDHTVKNLTYAQAKAYVFRQTGRHTVTYTVTNRYDTSIRRTVTVTFTVKAQPADVPDVTGMTEAEAGAALKNAGFRVKVDRKKYVMTAEEKARNQELASAGFNTVVSQSVSGTAPKGSAVTIFVLTEKTAASSADPSRTAAAGGSTLAG